MIYAVTYSNDKAAIPSALQTAFDAGKKGVALVDGVYKVTLNKIPTKSDSVHTISLLQVDSLDEINDLGAFDILGSGEDQWAVWQDVLDTPSKKAKLDLAYPRPVHSGEDEYGNPWSYQEPEIPGVFA